MEKCGKCKFWEMTMHEGHNLGWCPEKQALRSRFSEKCDLFILTSYEYPQAIYYKNEEKQRLYT